MVICVGLLIAGLFTSFAMIKYGPAKAREKFLNNEHAVMRTGKWWDICIKYIIPVSVVFVLIWWLQQSIAWYPNSWWNPFKKTSFGTIAFQIGIVIIIIKFFNNKLANSVKKKYFNDEYYPPIPDRVQEQLDT